MFQSREFRRQSHLENNNPEVSREDKGDYILSYNKRTKKALNLSYLDFENSDEFLQNLNEFEEFAKKIGVDKITLNLRESDPFSFKKETLNSKGYEKLVVLSQCGTEVNDEIIAYLSKNDIPEDYKVKMIDFDNLTVDHQIFSLIADNFPDGFAENPKEAYEKLSNLHKQGIANSSIQSYFSINKEGETVAFAKSNQIMQGSRKDLVHLTIAVTAKDHRKKGLYKELLKRRFVEAKKNNGKFAFTEADIETSRPILEGLGLKEFDRLTIYTKKLE